MSDSDMLGDPREASRQFRALLENTAEAVYVKDREGRYQLMNDAAAEVFGLDPNAVVGKSEADLFDAESAAEIRAVDERIVETGESVTEETVRYVDGERHVFLDDKFPYRDEDGEIVGVMGISREITDRKEQRRARQRAETFFQNTQDALFLVDVGEEAFRIERVNPAYERLTGLSDEEIHGEPIRSVFGEADGEAIETRYRECVDREEPLTYEERLSVPEEDSYWDTRIAPVIVDGEVVQIVGATRNVTERKRTEQRLEEQRDNLELLNQMMSHDIRNDLQVVSAYSEMLGDHVDEEGEEYLEHVLASVEAAVDLTQSARDLSEAMLMTERRRTPVSLRSALETQLGEVRATYGSAVVTVEGEVPGVSVLADDTLTSVFRNLLKNAIQHNDKPVPQVTVTADVGTDTAIVRIVDNGPGIPDERKDDVFGRGEKGLESEGTGIGLYLVETLMKRYGGDVRVEDNDPEGAVFTVELDLATTEGENETGDGEAS